MSGMTRGDLMARLEAASGPDRDADYLIAELVHPMLADLQRDGPGWFHPQHGKIAPPLDYTASIDAALSLYKTKPERVPTDPIKACLEALAQW